MRERLEIEQNSNITAVGIVIVPKGNLVKTNTYKTNGLDARAPTNSEQYGILITREVFEVDSYDEFEFQIAICFSRER